MSKYADKFAGTDEGVQDAPASVLQENWCRRSIERLLNDASKRFESRTLAHLKQSGHASLSLSQIHVARNLRMTGTQATELARRMDINKQTISELVVQLEEKGIIERNTDTRDKRAKTIFFTPAGQHWLMAFRAAQQRAENEMELELGKPLMDTLKQALAKYDNAATI